MTLDPEGLPSMQGPVCPPPLAHTERVVLGHGSGGRMSHDLIRRVFLSAWENPSLAAGDDFASLNTSDNLKLAISTDSHVVYPLFFPGGDIGKLAVCGTVNDVAMSGAKPLALTAGFILEEGLDIAILERVVASMRIAAEEAGVEIVAGDTKVVPRSKADQLYINTTGIGAVHQGMNISGRNAQPGDAVILSGPIGDHGIAVLAARGELGFETSIISDCAPLNKLIAAMLAESSNIHVLRDPTRGGLATSLNEIAMQSGVCIQLQERSIPIHPEVAAACEMLGFDPLYVACEGRLICIAAQEDAGRILDAMHHTRYGEEAVQIGEVLEAPAGRVLMRTSLGSSRIVDMLAGELLPRIC